MDAEIKEYMVSETQWWDNVAMALDLALERVNLQNVKVMALGQVVDCRTDAVQPAPAAPPEAPATVFAWLLNELRDREILRRLNQMPDETPMDLLILPFAIYCPENMSFVSVNNPSVTLEEHLRKLIQTIQ